MSFMRKIFLAVVMMLISVTAGFAYCLGSDPAQNFERADAVFLGQAVRGNDPYGEHTFRVLKSWKGINEPRVVINGGSYGCPGAYAFQLGEVYVVYARQSDDGLTTSNCSGNREVVNAAEQLRDLQDRPAIAVMPPFRYGGYGYWSSARLMTGDPIPVRTPQRSFLNMALVTGASVSFFLSLGFALPRLSRRLGFRGRKK